MMLALPYYALYCILTSDDAYKDELTQQKNALSYSQSQFNPHTRRIYLEVKLFGGM